MKETEKGWDQKLHIDTGGRDESEADDNCFPYEPTPYPVLERLAESGFIDKENHVLDYGCGKGRVCFFLAYECGCRTTGIDFSEKMISAANENLVKFPNKRLVSFHCCPAQNYEITDEDAFFFFNPFRETILHSVIGKIRESLYHQNRQTRIFCYYPSDEFVACLMMEPDVEFIDEIDCHDLFDGNNPRERILIFEMNLAGGCFRESRNRNII